MLSSKQIGTITEYKCMTYIMELGYNVSVPIGENSKYDFIIDTGDALIKVQCKHSTVLNNGSFEFSCETTRINATSVKCCTYTKHDIDYFCTWYNNVCYLVPVEECGRAKKVACKSSCKWSKT